MSGGLNEIATQEAHEIVVDGKKLLLEPLRVKDYAAAANRIKDGEWKSAKDAAQVILAMTLVPGDREVILKRAYAEERAGNPVEIGDVVRWFKTPGGKLFEWYLRLRKHQPELSEDDIDQMFGDVIIGMVETELETDPIAEG